MLSWAAWLLKMEVMMLHHPLSPMCLLQELKENIMKEIWRQVHILLHLTVDAILSSNMLVVLYLCYDVNMLSCSITCIFIKTFSKVWGFASPKRKN